MLFWHSQNTLHDFAVQQLKIRGILHFYMQSPRQNFIKPTSPPSLCTAPSLPRSFLTPSTIWLPLSQIRYMRTKASMGCCKSQSITAAASIFACANPAKMAASFPKFLDNSNPRILRLRFASCSIFSQVSSQEPSLTKIISYGIFSFCQLLFQLPGYHRNHLSLIVSRQYHRQTSHLKSFLLQKEPLLL